MQARAPALLPCATTAGIGGCSSGNQSGGFDGSSSCLSVYVLVLPGTCMTLSGSGGGVTAGGGVPGPKAQSGRSAAMVVVGNNRIATTQTSRFMDVPQTFLCARTFAGAAAWRGF